jgi:hypothetical protein
MLNTLLAQSSKLESILKSKSLRVFDSYFDSLLIGNYYSVDDYKFKRELVNNYYESIYYCSREIKTDTNYFNAIMSVIRVNIVFKDDSIILYKVTEDRGTLNKKGNWQYKTPNTFSFYDKVMLHRLNKEYTVAFNTNINSKEFFSPITYGDGCGFDGEKTKERKQINKFVKERNKQKLLLWLKSTILEKQVYALDGLYQLKQLGITFSSVELSYINNVMRKRGQLKTCDGCDFADSDIQTIIKNFKF